MEGVWSIHIKKHFFPPWHGIDLVNTISVTFCVLAGMGCALSKRGEIHFLSSLEWDGFAQHMFRWFFCPRWHGIVFVNICWDTICVLAGIVNISWDTFYVLAGIGWLRSTHVMHLVSSLTRGGGWYLLYVLAGMGGVVEHMLRCILWSSWSG